ncbi:MAG: Holliday junction resolvase RuvX [Pirellulales bacterium]|nr:Holliday junction resolvase RuvX [Pirellulales bacterium]
MSSDRQRIAGIDYGTVRIGIALATTGVDIASPYENYTRRNPKLDAKYFREFATQEKIDLFVVGLPVHLSGEESQKSTEARQFGAWLTELTEVPVEYYDERFTSAEAEQHLLDSNLTSKQRKARLDKLAAQIMLASYLERGSSDAAKPGAIDD